MPKSPVCLEFPSPQSGQALTVVTHKLLTIWSREMDRQEAERVSYWVGIRNF
jgi:hypothetical protein